jgi:uridine kinase
MPKIIAISGASGAGKTHLIKHLSAMLDCPFLLFDEYTDANTYPKDMKDWYQRGANVSEIKTPAFIKAIKSESAKCTAHYVLIEEPFGRQRKELTALIDHVVLLDTPLEVCLSRIISRHINPKNVNPSISITKYLAKYDDHLRAIYINTVNQVRSNCDLIITERIPDTQWVNKVQHWLENLRED